MRDWLLSHAERGNPATHLDDHGDPDTAWSDGNLVRPLIHGSVYFGELSAAIERTGRADTIMFVDWRGDPDEQLTGEPGSSVAERLCAAARAASRSTAWSGAPTWTGSGSPSRRTGTSGEEINAAGGCCLLDMRVRVGGSHHQKFILLRHADHPEWDVAFLGGIDLCHRRRDDIEHDGDPQPQPMAAVYGPTPPWHDIQLEIPGPAIADVETVFRERWDDPRPLSRNPMHRIADRIRGDDEVKRPLPPPRPGPPRSGRTRCSCCAPTRTAGAIPVRAPGRAKHRAWLHQSASPSPATDLHRGSVPVVAARWPSISPKPCARTSELRLIAVLPHYPDQDGRISLPPNLVGRADRAAADHRGRPRPRRRLRHRERGRDADLRARQGVYHRRRLGDDRLGQLQPQIVDARLGTHRRVWDENACRADRLGHRAPWTNRVPTRARYVPRLPGSTSGWTTVTVWISLTRRPPSPRSPMPRPVSKSGRRATAARRGRRAIAAAARAETVGWLTRAWATPMYRALYDPDGRGLRERWRGTNTDAPAIA